MAEVGKAISQTIHYLESKKGPYKLLKGIVIIGRKREIEDKFIETFNSYLHGIEVLTYDDIYDNTRKIIDIFKSNENKAQQNNPSTNP